MGACLSSSKQEADAERRRRRPRGKAGPAPEKDAAEAPAVEFGYERDFEGRYEVGRLLGHGQFGYTFAAVDRLSGDRVAVKRIDKAKVRFSGFSPHLQLGSVPCGLRLVGRSRRNQSPPPVVGRFNRLA